MRQVRQNISHTLIILKTILGIIFLIWGCTIYVLLRSTSINLYKWCSALGLSNIIDIFRYNIQNSNVLDFVKFNLPDGLYNAAYILFIDSIWYENKGLIKIIIILLIPLIAISSEILQYFGLIRGTFDKFDLICYAIPLFTYIAIKLINNKCI